MPRKRQQLGLALREAVTDNGYVETYTVTSARGKALLVAELEYAGDGNWIVRIDRGRGFRRPHAYRDGSAAAAEIAAALERIGAIPPRRNTKM